MASALVVLVLPQAVWAPAHLHTCTDLPCCKAKTSVRHSHMERNPGPPPPGCVRLESSRRSRCRSRIPSQVREPVLAPEWVQAKVTESVPVSALDWARALVPVSAQVPTPVWVRELALVSVPVLVPVSASARHLHTCTSQPRRMATKTVHHGRKGHTPDRSLIDAQHCLDWPHKNCKSSSQKQGLLHRMLSPDSHE